MATLEELFPALGLRISAGPIELRGLTDEHLVELAELADAGIHEDGSMPFTTPWTLAPQMPRTFVQYHWRTRAEFSEDEWTLNLGVWHDGELVGIQGISTKRYLVTRTGETGSWLGRRHQGRGIGTRMRQTFCAFMFDHLDAQEITSGAFLDNPASLAVSRKVGYRENGVHRFDRMGELALNQRLALRPEDLNRGEPLEVEGLAPFRRLVGLVPRDA